MNAQVIEEWKKSKKIQFYAKGYNFANLRRVSFGNTGCPINFAKLMGAVGVSPQDLVAVFKKEDAPKKKGLFNFLSKKKSPKNFEDLGSFPLEPERFVALAKILGKTIEVIREDGMYCEFYDLFTVHPSGEVIFAKKK